MITADKLQLLINMPTAMLEQAVGKGAKFRERKFQGITNGGEFCYLVTDTEGAYSKVFLKYDPTVDRVSATLGWQPSQKAL
jgi:hypothetical protein